MKWRSAVGTTCSVPSGLSPMALEDEPKNGGKRARDDRSDEEPDEGPDETSEPVPKRAPTAPVGADGGAGKRKRSLLRADSTDEATSMKDTAEQLAEDTKKAALAHRWISDDPDAVNTVEAHLRSFVEHVRTLPAASAGRQPFDPFVEQYVPFVFQCLL
eukprot:3628995-Pyramimonas_sp.AAC.1